MKLVPVYDNLVVALDKDQGMSAGGLWLPKEEKGYETGVILALGPGSMYEKGILPCPYKVGQRILFMRYKDVSLKMDDKDVVLLCYEDVVAIVEE